MTGKTRTIRWWLGGFSLVAVFWLCAAAASALIMINEGSQPVANLGWPSGSENVANSPGRLRYMEGPPFGGGEHCFEFRCQDTAQFNEALAKFGAIRVPRLGRVSSGSMAGGGIRLAHDKPLLLVVHDGRPPVVGVPPPPVVGVPPAVPGLPARVAVIGDSEPPDWKFTIWSPASYYRAFSGDRIALYSEHPSFRQPVPPPRIDVFVGPGGPIVWADVQVPDNVQVVDERAEAAPAAAKGGGLVRGGVFDMGTHQGIAGARVFLVPRTPQTQTEVSPPVLSDAEGRFEIAGVRPDYYDVVIAADGHAPRKAAGFYNTAGHAVLDFDTLLATTASLRGTVVNENGGPVAGATVSPRDVLGMDGLGYACTDAATVVTDAQGAFELAALPEGRCGLHCVATSLYQRNSASATYDVTGRPTGNEPEVKIVMVGTGTVRGKVTDPAGQAPSVPFIAELQPRGGSKVGLWSGSAQCQEGGVFEFSGVPRGEYVVTVRPNPGREADVSEPKPVTVTGGSTVEAELVFVSERARK